MIELKDSSGSVIGVIEGDGTVKDRSGNRLGRVRGGEVHNKDGSTVGYYKGTDFYRGTSHAGYLEGDKVFDINDHQVGKIGSSGDEAAGAAVFFLFEV